VQLTAESDPVPARDDTWRMLSDGDPDAAAEAVARMRASGGEPAATLGVLAAAVRLEQAVAELDGALQAAEEDPGHAEPSERAAAVELLARLLALRGDAADGAEVWRHGAGSPDPAVAAQVRERLRRGFLDPGERDERPWWEEFVEAAVVEDSVAMLAGELFSAVSRIQALLATGRTEEAWQVPADYLWGQALQDDLAERLREG
jgi:hypothetical protein